jgi:hypothetical protein
VRHILVLVVPERRNYCGRFFFPKPLMTPTLPIWMFPTLAALLSSIPCRAQFEEASPISLHTMSVNLAPAVNREVQLSYERALLPASSLEVTIGTRIPSAGDRVTKTIVMPWPASYRDRVFPLPYERSFAAGVHWKRYFYPDLGFVPFVSPGVLYRFGFFDDKSYAEEYPLNIPAFTQQFSLRKHEATVRILFGVRRQFYLGDGRSAFAAEASWGVGAGKRFGRFLNYRQQAGPGFFPFFDPWTSRPGDAQTVPFNVGIFTMPVSFKIGYSWGG